MDRVKFIRKAEKQYHDAYYDNHSLFENGTWLEKPESAIMDLLPLLDHHPLHVLDLGAGVGRNSIPIAIAIKHRQGKVTCVDLLDSALEHLATNIKQHQLNSVIDLERADIGDYVIKEQAFDLIVAVSSLEHVASEAVFDKVLERMVSGTKRGGMNVLIVNTEIEERDAETGEKLPTLMEVNLQTDELLHKLKQNYSDWKVVREEVEPTEFITIRQEQKVTVHSRAVTFAVRKKD